MNLKRGFRRITLVLAVVVSIICAGLSFSTINEEHYWAQERLRMQQRNLEREQKRYREHLETKQRSQQEEKVVQPFDDTPPSFYQPYRFKPKFKTEAELKQLEAKVKELEKGFWVTLSSRGLVGLFVLASSVGAVAAFGGFWLFYVLINWVVRGFYD